MGGCYEGISVTYRRVMLKLSGGALAGEGGLGFDTAKVQHHVTEILALCALGLEVAVVIGGGNILRGGAAEGWGLARPEADGIGMLGTVVNGLLLRGVLQRRAERRVRLLSAVEVGTLAPLYDRLGALEALEQGSLLLLAGGNGQPFVSTDYPSVQRALELGCNALLVAKNGVDGVYDRDPNVHPDARRYEQLSFAEVIRLGVRVMDPPAFVLAHEHGLPLHIYDAAKPGAAANICQGRPEGTFVHP